MILRSLFLSMANSKFLESIARKSPFAARTTSRFVAGETVEQIVAPVRELNTIGITASLDFLGESVTTREEVAATLNTYRDLFHIIDREGLNANVSVKLTALGLDIDEQFCFETMKQLLDIAGTGQFVRIDMESSAYTQRTLDLFYRLWNEAGYRNVGVVIQAYLKRSAKDIDDLNKLGARVRLCKGAYKEPVDVALETKVQVDNNFVALMQSLLKHGTYPGIATHDTAMIDATKRFASEESISPDKYEFQMLYGIRRDLQKELRQQGYGMRIYTPFGTHWYPYFMRRLAERPANVWFVLKNAFRS